MKDEKSTEITNLFSKIVSKNQLMNLLPSLSSIVKGLLESKLKEIIQQKDKKRDEYLKTKLEKKEIREKI